MAGFGAVIAAATRSFRCDRGDWVVGRRSDSLARAVPAYAARRLTGLPSREIASAVGYRNVSVPRRPAATAMTDRSFGGIVASIGEC